MAKTEQPARTPAQRKQDERKRHRDAGRVAVTAWIKPRDRKHLALYVELLNGQVVPRPIVDGILQEIEQTLIGEATA